MCCMAGSTHLSTWISAEAKQRFAAAAARQGLSESALLKRLVEQMLASADIGDLSEPIAPADLRDARVTIRLVPEDRALLRERAAARTMPAATYVSVLVRAPAAARAASGSGALEPAGVRPGARGDRSSPQHDGAPPGTGHPPGGAGASGG